jgi:hypothetical protein
VVELDEGIHNSDSQFVVMGSGTSNTSPEITCTCACLLPHCGCWPSAHSAWLARRVAGGTKRHHLLRRTRWTATQIHATPYGKFRIYTRRSRCVAPCAQPLRLVPDVLTRLLPTRSQLRFGTWVEGQVMFLKYWSQHVNIRSAGGSATFDAATNVKYEDTHTTATFTLGAPTDGGAYVRLSIEPPAFHHPQILCHGDWPPPPPPPPPPSPPPPAPPPRPFPPPPRLTIDADSNCPIGGEVWVQQAGVLASGRKSLQVVVEPDRWEAGYLMVVGVHGSHVAVSDVVRPGSTPACRAAAMRAQRLPRAAPQSYKASHVEDGSAGSGEHVFMLLPGPTFRSFSFNLAGADVRIASLTCRCFPHFVVLPG